MEVRQRPEEEDEEEETTMRTCASSGLRFQANARVSVGGRRRETSLLNAFDAFGMHDSFGLKHRHSSGRIQVANWKESRLGRLRGPFAPFALQFPSPCEAFRRAGSVASFVLRPTAAMTLTSEMDRALCEDVQNTGFMVGVCIDNLIHKVLM